LEYLSLEETLNVWIFIAQSVLYMYIKGNISCPHGTDLVMTPHTHEPKAPPPGLGLSMLKELAADSVTSRAIKLYTLN